MFNTNSYNRNIVSTHVNAVSGNITKTYKDSFFVRFHLKSDYANRILSPKPYILGEGYSKDKIEVQVIQMVICGDMEVIAEVMYSKKYEEMLNDKTEVN